MYLFVRIIRNTMKENHHYAHDITSLMDSFSQILNNLKYRISTLKIFPDAL